MAALEFMSKPGQVLADIYEVTRTTISKIKRKESHLEVREEYDSLPLEERQKIYQIFCDSSNFYEKKVNSTIIKTKRKLTETQVHLILLNEELGRPVTLKDMLIKVDLSSNNTIYTILNGQSYKDYSLSYEKLTDEQKNILAQLLSD